MRINGLTYDINILTAVESGLASLVNKSPHSVITDEDNTLLLKALKSEK